MKQSYLVTGGSGFIGANLVQALVKKGIRVRCLDDGSRGHTSRLKGDVELIQGDVRDVEVVNRAARGVDGLIHLAYINGTEFFYSKPDQVLDVAVRGLLNVLDAGREQGVKDFILASSSEVYQTPPRFPTDEDVPLIVPDVKNPRYSYGGGKIISELMTLHCGTKIFDRVCIFRPHNVYGPDMGTEHVVPQFILRLKNLLREKINGPLPFEIQGDGKQTRSFIYIDDFTEGVLKILERGSSGEIYHIGTQDEIEMRALAQMIARQLNCSLDLKEREEPLGATRRRVPDTRKLNALGFNAKISLEEGLRRTVDFYLKT